MGLAVLPGRLKEELNLVGRYLTKQDKTLDPSIDKHVEWMMELEKTHTFTKKNVDSILREEVGLVFEKVLTCCGVFKLNESGIKSFMKFIETI